MSHHLGNTPSPECLFVPLIDLPKVNSEVWTQFIPVGEMILGCIWHHIMSNYINTYDITECLTHGPGLEQEEKWTYQIGSTYIIPHDH